MADPKRFTLREVQGCVDAWRNQGLNVVFTNGVFDLLHVGHLEVLEQAALQGDRLVVGVNSDESVRRLGKGSDRPIHPEVNRARLLRGLRCVDAVVVFEEDTPLQVICSLRPHVLVKGGDYDANCTDVGDSMYMVGSAEVKSWGGRTLAIPLVPGESTTSTLSKIRQGS